MEQSEAAKILEEAAAEARAEAVAGWRALAADVEVKLQRVGADDAKRLTMAVRELLQKWLEGGAPVGSATMLLLAGRLTAAQYALREDLKYLAGTACHEAGHAAVGWYLGVGFSLVTVRPNVGGSDGGSVIFDSNSPAWSDPEARVLVSLAGRAAQEAAHDTRARWSESDEEMAYRDLLLCRPNMGKEDANAFFHYCQVRVAGLVRMLWPAVEALSGALVAKLEIPGPEAEAIIAAALPTIRPAAGARRSALSVVDENGGVDSQGPGQPLEVLEVERAEFPSLNPGDRGLLNPGLAGKLGLTPPLGLAELLDAERNRGHS